LIGGGDRQRERGDGDEIAMADAYFQNTENRLNKEPISKVLLAPK
jgi:hypothetical protein